MRQFCSDVEADKEYSDKLKKKFIDLVDWYKEFHINHSVRLKDWLEKIYFGESYSNELTVNLSKTTVEILSDNIEVLVKIILSLYVKGPRNLKWFDGSVTVNFLNLIEILNQKLQAYNEGQNLALAVLLESRAERNGTAHRNDLYEVASIIRQMNILREMLIFVDPELEGQLTRFEYPNGGYIDIGAIFSDDKLNPEERTLVLIAGSLHDIDAEKRVLLANIPWTMVIDLDAASKFGGLRAAVNDNSRINDKKWDESAIPDPASRSYGSNFTEWYNCGNLLNFKSYNKDLNDSNKPEYSCVTQRDSIVNSPDKFVVARLFSKSIESLKNSSYPITILFIHDDLTYVNRIITASVNNWPKDFYSFVGVYYQNLNDIIQRIALNHDFDYPDKDLDTFNFFRCDLHSFFYELSNYKEQLPILKATDRGRTIPSKDGAVTLEVNRVQTLASFADVLYSDCGNCDREESERNKQAFYRGGKVAWSVFKAHDGAIALFDVEFEWYRKEVKDRLGKAFPSPNNKVVVFHKPGIGGSTFIRQLGYSFHKEFPVICVRPEYKQIGIIKIAEELKMLYDNLNKGILVLADDMDPSDADDLSVYLARSQTRPFCVVVGKRAYNTDSGHTLSSFNDKIYEELKVLYKNHSPLSREELEEKDKNLNSILDSNNHFPFIIALYYLDKDFNGIPGYVEKTLQNCPGDPERKVISYAALLNIYNQSHPLPNDFAIFISSGVLSGNSFIKMNPFVSSILLRVEKNCIATKHYLISEEILRQTVKSLYHVEDSSNYKMYLSNLALDFIDDYFKFLSKVRRFNEADNDLIKGMFIYSKDDDKFSQLIMDIRLNEKSEDVLKRLVEAAEQLFKFCPENDKDRLRAGLGHFCGHLGRFYHNPDNPRKNINKAIEYAEKAVENMDSSQDGDHRDHLIYHMCGAAYQRKLYDKLDNLKNAYDIISSEDKEAELNEAETLLNKACEMFDAAIKYGGYQYGCLSELEIYINFLVKLYVGEGEQRTSLLSKSKHEAYKGEIGSLFDMLSCIELDENGRQLEQQYRWKYEGIIVNDKDDVNYYQGLVDSAHSSGNVELLFKARFGLLYARLRQWEKARGDDKRKESEHIMALLDDICSEPVSDTYHTKLRMVSAYNKWLYFARLNDKDVSRGIAVAERWRELSISLKMNDPRPYYNEYVLRYLEELDGYTNAIGKAEVLRGECSKIAEQGNAHIFGKKATIRDVLVEQGGRRGMGRLYPCKHIVDIPKDLPLFKVSGELIDIEAKMGFIKVKKPIPWENREAKFALSSRTTLGENFITHEVEFYGAFTYEQMVAYNGMVADVTSGESIQKQYKEYLSKGCSNPKPRHMLAEVRSQAPKSMITSGNINAVFYPDCCEYTNKYYLNGIVDVNGERQHTGFPVELLKRLNPSIVDLEAEANIIINAKGGCGIPVICFEKTNGSYGIDVERSFSNYDELFGKSSDGVPNTTPQSSTEKVDYSFLDKKEGKFFPTGKQNKKTVFGRFECEGRNYEATLRCNGAKMCNDIIVKGVAEVAVSSTASGKIIVKPII